jgi:hypothetical protein
LDPTRADISSELTPEEYLSWPFHKQIDWHIERHLISLVRWLRQWLDIAGKRSSPEVLWTNYDELVNDERALLVRIFDFHGIPANGLALKAPSKTIEVHYRNGVPDEWKAVLSEQQKSRCAEIIGTELLDHFKWEKVCSAKIGDKQLRKRALGWASRATLQA